VASRTDSRVVLDEMGADKLLGNGDMLFLSPGTSTLLRGQGTYIGDEEINSVVEFVGRNEQQFVKELVQLKAKDAGGSETGGKKLPNRDELYEGAIDVVVREGRGSVSLLQRALGIGYGRAARLVDYMAEDGIVGDYNGSQAREVLITIEQWQEMSGGGGGAIAAPAASAPTPPKSGRVLTVAARSQPQIDDDEEEDEEYDSAEADEYEEDEYEEADESEAETPAPKRRGRESA
jgi:S-DNA-T family DNA segregation ATPase FtsK/SpoIIIE